MGSSPDAQHIDVDAGCVGKAHPGEKLFRAHTSMPNQTLSSHPPRSMLRNSQSRPTFGLHYSTTSPVLGAGGLEFPARRDVHGPGSPFPNREEEESFQQHVLSSFSSLIKALISLSAPDHFLAILALLPGYSRAPALAIVSFP